MFVWYNLFMNNTATNNAAPAILKLNVGRDYDGRIDYVSVSGVPDDAQSRDVVHAFELLAEAGNVLAIAAVPHMQAGWWDLGKGQILYLDGVV